MSPDYSRPFSVVYFSDPTEIGFVVAMGQGGVWLAPQEFNPETKRHDDPPRIIKFVPFDRIVEIAQNL